MAFNLRNRSFVKELDFTPQEWTFLLGLAEELKRAKYTGSERPRLTGKTVAAGVADADDPLFTAVTAGKTLNRIVLFRDTGVAGTSRLIGAIDTLAGGGAMSIPTSGGDLLFRFDNGANKIFKL